MKQLRKVVAALFATAALTAGSHADAQDKTPTIVELFTSQGCYSCPPAEAFLGELADRTDIVALEFHVDYWDTLNYMWHGQWKDPFSSADYTRRQRLYNVAIRGQSGVYTPQMIIDGRYEAVGSRRGQVEAAIGKARASSKLSVTLSPSNGGVAAKIAGDAKGPADIYLIEFLERTTTEVKKGENHGKTLVSRNIVRAVTKLGSWKGTTNHLRLPKDAGQGDNRGCAVIVQAPNHGHILGGGLCPHGPSS